MTTDSIINIALSVIAILFVFVGVHASVSPVSPDDLALPFLKRHRTRIWILLALLAIANLVLVQVQTRRQSASTLTVETFKTEMESVRKMIQRSNGLGQLTDSATLSPPKRVLQSAKSDTQNQVAVIAEAKKPELVPLTTDQLSLLVLSANQIATEMESSYAASLKGLDDRDKENEKQAFESCIKRGCSQDEARSYAGSFRTAGFTMDRNSEKRSLAIGSVTAHDAEIKSILNVLATDPVRFQGPIRIRAEGVQNGCQPGGPEGADVAGCASGLRLLANAIK
jgi:hypothetical protein